MKKAILIALISSFLLIGCTLGFRGGSDGGSLVIVPALPLIIEIDNDQFYYQNGYYYNYQGSIWLYSESRHGPWLRLPRSHYPREVHYKDKRRRDKERHYVR